MEKKQETFRYTYSAVQQEEVRSIRKKYLPQEEDKMERLRKLHHSATQKAEIWSLVLGIAGALIMGTGMSLVMTDLGAVFGLENPVIPGVVIGIMGMILAAMAYPTYRRILRSERQRIAPEILQLSEELMK